MTLSTGDSASKSVLLEVAVRASWAHHMAMTFGPHGYLDQAHHDDPVKHSESVADLVKLNISTEAADLAFVRMVLQEEARQKSALPVETLLVLAALRETRRMGSADIGLQLQCAPAAASKLIEPLVESGLIQAHGMGRGRQYTLSPQVYKQLGQTHEYAQQAEFDELQQVELIRNLLRQKPRIKREDVIALCRLSPRQAKHKLDRMVASGILQRHGQKRGTYYTATQTVVV